MRPAPLALERPTPVEVALTAAPTWPGVGDGGEEGRRGGLAPVPRAARPSPVRKLERRPAVRQPAQRALAQPSEPSEQVVEEQPPSGGDGAPGPGIGTAGTGAGGGSFFDLHPNFRWVWQLDRGRYRVFVPQGYTLQIQVSFESTLENRLEVTTLAGQPVVTFDERGVFRWSYRNQAAGTRVLVFRGPDRHDCRHAQVGLRARIGFEDRTDQDCNEPVVLLRLVRQ